MQSGKERASSHFQKSLSISKCDSKITTISGLAGSILPPEQGSLAEIEKRLSGKSSSPLLRG